MASTQLVAWNGLDFRWCFGAFRWCFKAHWAQSLRDLGSGHAARFQQRGSRFLQAKVHCPRGVESQGKGMEREREISRYQDIKMMFFISSLEMFGRDSSLMGSCKLHGQYWDDKSFQHRNQTPQNPQSAWNRAPFVSMLRNQTLTPHRG